VADERYKYVCNLCGSDDIAADAWAQWDIETQQWELLSTYDDKFCRSCETECKPVTVPVERDKSHE
jgi:hypothetical protein